MEINLIKFIRENADWEQKLSEHPYYLTIKRKDPYILFMYNQINSDFYNPIVKECRGIILEESTFTPVCVPFFKFGNYGEGYVDELDWNTARVQEKVDGSIIKVWYHNNQWHISTNSTIDARDATVSEISQYATYYDLFMAAAKNSRLDISSLDRTYTWMFELISSYNRVVVPYTETEVRHIGTRNIHTLEECDIDIGVTKPKAYGFTSLDECISMASKLPFSEEGYVVVDKYWHRNKVKSPAYVAAHHLKNNGVVTYERIVELVRENERDEFLVYHPEFKEGFTKVQNAIDEFISRLESDKKYASENVDLSNRKTFAMYATKTICPAFLFGWLDKKCDDTKEWLWNQTDEKIVKWVGLK